MANIRSAAASATVAADGTALVTFQPTGSWNSWEILSISVRMSVLDNSVARIYEGAVPVDAAFIEGTFSGAQDTSPQTPGHLILNPGDLIAIQWTGATIGATATATLRVRETDSRVQ